jgi:hypothetical protein
MGGLVLLLVYIVGVPITAATVVRSRPPTDDFGRAAATVACLLWPGMVAFAAVALCVMLLQDLLALLWRRS